MADYSSIRLPRLLKHSPAFHALGMNGRLVTAGAHGGPNVAIDFAHLYHKKITIMGRTGHKDEDIPKCFKSAAEGKIKAQIEKLLASAELRRDLSRRVRLRAEQHLSWETIADNTLAVYHRALKHKGHARA